ncbi:hypothetical protein BvCmsNSNP031_04916 [Escherichia coli]|nr:hypothetical protein BvCmsNSNP031_04916 [Escherichia coli]
MSLAACVPSSCAFCTSTLTLLPCVCAVAVVFRLLPFTDTVLPALVSPASVEDALFSMRLPSLCVTDFSVVVSVSAEATSSFAPERVPLLFICVALSVSTSSLTSLPRFSSVPLTVTRALSFAPASPDSVALRALISSVLPLLILPVLVRSVAVTFRPFPWTAPVLLNVPVFTVASRPATSVPPLFRLPELTVSIFPATLRPFSVVSPVVVRVTFSVAFTAPEVWFRCCALSMAFCPAVSSPPFCTICPDEDSTRFLSVTRRD